MKNAMKKLMSLVLVAVLLVSAVPFAASAEEYNYWIEAHVDGNGIESKQVYISGASDAVPSDDAIMEAARTLYADYFANYNTQAITEKGAIGAAINFTNVPVTPPKDEDEPDPTPAPTTALFWIEIRVNGEGKESKQMTMPVNPDEGTILAYAKSADGYPAYFAKYSQYELQEVASTSAAINFTAPVEEVPATTYNVKFFNAKNECHWNIDVAAGSTVDVADNTTGTQVTYAEEHVGTKTGYTFAGWQMNGKGDVLSTATAARLAINATTSFYPVFVANETDNDDDDDYVVDEEWMKDIWLYIYTNNDLVQPAKRVLLNDYEIIKDHVINKSNALSVVDDYFKATNSNNGIIWKGMYRETEDITALQFVQQLGRDDYIDNLDVLRSKGTVVIKVRVTGVTAKTSATADSSNPKTGDEIYMAITVLGLSAASLAAVAYVYSKKRMAK